MSRGRHFPWFLAEPRLLLVAASQAPRASCGDGVGELQGGLLTAGNLGGAEEQNCFLIKEKQPQNKSIRGDLHRKGPLEFRDSLARLKFTQRIRGPLPKVLGPDHRRTKLRSYFLSFKVMIGN